MDNEIFSQKNKLRQVLFPLIEPYRQQLLEVGDGHQIYVEECGNPDGLAVMVVHGGPGGGCSPTMRRYFDPEYYRIVLFDQRGCGRSRPFASIQNNDTWKLISDMDFIRNYLGIPQVILFGGSWGAALSLLYAEQFPERVSKLILRGVFTMTKSELDWFYTEDGAGKFWPEAWKAFKNMVPKNEQNNIIHAYHKRLFGNSPSEQASFSKAWANWENSLASYKSLGRGFNQSTEYARAFARIENHYFINNGFLEEDGQIFRDLNTIDSIPTIIVQGRYDMICPPATAEALHSRLKNSKLSIVPEAGHAMSEPGIIAGLINATEEFKYL